MRVESQLVGVRDLRRGVWISRLAMLALWLGGAAIFAGVGHLDGTTVGCWTPMGLLAGTSILLGRRHGAFAGAVQRLSAGSLTVEGGVIRVEVKGRIHSFRVGDVVSGWTEPEVLRGMETAVLLMRDGTEVRFAASRPAVVEQAMRAAGVAPDQRAVKIRVRPGLSLVGRATSIFQTFIAVPAMLVCLLVVLLGLFAALRVGSGALIFSLIFAIFTVGFGALIRRLGPSLFTTTLSIGTDGVVVERLLHKRFLRRAEIEDILYVPDAVVLRLAGGESVRVPASPGAGVTVVGRIDEALRVRSTPRSTLAQLDRDGRPVSAWIADLRALSRGAQGYREAAVARHDLIDVLNDGAAPAERRIAAAVALSADQDEETRAAVRLAADTCVDERFRVVLRGTEEMPEEELAEAIAEAVGTR